MRICVILPAYNAAGTLGPLLRQLKQMGLDPLVVNDGSTDDTAKVATESGTLVINHLANQGKGAALRTGFAYALQAGYDAIVTMDSDGQHDPAEIPRLLDAVLLPNAGIIVGHRLVDREAMPLIRRGTNWVMSFVISCLTRQRIPDSQCGFRVIRRQVLEQAQLSSQRFDIESELLLAAASAGWTVASVPIRAIYTNHHSHIRPVRDGVRFIRLSLRYLFRPRVRPRA